MKNTIDKYLISFIHYSYCLLFFSIPLAFLTGHVELFQFNKMMLVYLFTSLIVSSWLLRMVINKRFFIRKTPFDIPILLFLSSQIISTVFSIHIHTSLWGYYTRFHGGLISIICYLLLFYAFLSNNALKNNKNTPIKSKLLLGSLVSLLLSSTIVALYGILEHYGIDANYWVQDVRNRVFSTLGQPNWLAAFLIAISFLPLSTIEYLTNKKDSKTSQKLVIWYFIFAIYFVTLLFTKSRSGLLGFFIAYLAFWVQIALLKSQTSLSYLSEIKDSLKDKKQILYSNFIRSTLLIIFISVIVGTPYTPSLPQLKNKYFTKTKPPLTQKVVPDQLAPPTGGTESGDIRIIVWKGSLDVFKHWPIFGSGVETFAYSYYNFRPLEHNYVSEWDFLYNKAHNEYLNFLATTGAFGLGSLLFFMYSYTLWSLKKIFIKNSLLSAHYFLLTGLLSGYLGLCVALFFGFSTVTTGLLFFIIPAFSFAATDAKQKFLNLSFTKTNSKESSLSALQIVTAIIILAIPLISIYNISKRWYADRVFVKGRRLSQANQMSEALIVLQNAVNLAPNQPYFRDKLAMDLARSASALFAEGELETALLFRDTAKAHSDLVMQQNNVHLTFLKNRALVMFYLSKVEPDYLKYAFETLERAQLLAPTEPSVPYTIGLFHLEKGNTNEALKELEKAIDLKADYLDARLALAKAYEKQGNKEKELEQYQYIVDNINPQNPEATAALNLKQ